MRRAKQDPMVKTFSAERSLKEGSMLGEQSGSNRVGSDARAGQKAPLFFLMVRQASDAGMDFNGMSWPYG